jgi:protein-S-isoprenylcysteine O-methyltransferase Ste14
LYYDTLVVIRDKGDPMTDPGNAGVIARPIRLFPAALLAGLVLDRLLPLPNPVSQNGLGHGVTLVIAGGLFLLGIGIFRAGTTGFVRAGTPLPTNQPARVLVTTGIYGHSRNPVYLGFFFMYLGIGIALHSPWILALTIPVAFTIRYGVVAREEAYLDRRFGDAYRDYKASVPRWL